MELTKIKNEILNYVQKLDKKVRIQLGAGTLTVFLLFFVIFWPAWFVRPSLKGKIQNMKTSLATAETKIRLEPQMLKEKKECATFLQGSASRFFTESEAQGLIGILTEIGEKNDVKFLSTKPEKSVGNIPDAYKEKYIPLAYLVAVEGGFHSLGSFVSDIENYSKILRVDEFSVTPQEEEPHQLVGEIRVTGFLLKQGLLKTADAHGAK